MQGDLVACGRGKKAEEGIFVNTGPLTLLTGQAKNLPFVRVLPGKPLFPLIMMNFTNP